MLGITPYDATQSLLTPYDATQSLLTPYDATQSLLTAQRFLSLNAACMSTDAGDAQDRPGLVMQAAGHMSALGTGLKPDP